MMKKISCLLIGLFLLGAAASQAADEEIRYWIRTPAISPDGSEIAFSYQGDIFLVNSSGGQARSLTTHVNHESHPVWSPDGESIAYASDRHGNFDIFLIPASGGTSKRLTHHSADDIPSAFSADGEGILFSSARTDPAYSRMFPSGRMTELYTVSISGTAPRLVLPTPAENAVFGQRGKEIFYQDRSGIENYWRKHAQSSDTRDIWAYNIKTGEHRQITHFSGEDRDPVIVNGKELYYLSEQSGTFNVWSVNARRPKKPEQVTRHQIHPVRFLSASADGVLCYVFDGHIWLLPPKSDNPMKVDIHIPTDDRVNPVVIKEYSEKATEMAVTPDGKEIIFIVRGDIFATSAEHKLTRQLTFTPEQERSVSVSSDGKSIVFAGERSGSWNLYQIRLSEDTDKHFYNAVNWEELPLLVSDDDSFQPLLSPNDSLVAFLHNRDEIRILNRHTAAVHTLLPAAMNYSYSDGDIQYSWSPDSKWLACLHLPSSTRWVEDIALVDVLGAEITNVTLSGYYEFSPRWSASGNMIYCFSNEYGKRSHGSWGSENDVFGFYTSDSAREAARLTKLEYEDLDIPDSTRNNKLKALDHPLNVERDGFRDRRRRLTPHSSMMADALLSRDGMTLYYTTRFEKGVDLWKVELLDPVPKRVIKLDAGDAGSLQFDDEGKHVYLLLDNGKMVRVELENGKKHEIKYRAEMALDQPSERLYLFDHIWRQVREKFYLSSLHGADWDAMGEYYRRFVPQITSGREYAELLSEMLGELNASHTGAYFRFDNKKLDHTAALGLLYDSQWQEDGLKVLEILKNGPADRPSLGIEPGTVIERINGSLIRAGSNPNPLLNRLDGKYVTLTVMDSDGENRRDIQIRPVSFYREQNLMYRRWVERSYEYVDSLSDGQIGYIHVRGMNDSSFRKTFSDLFGRNLDKKAVILDTRFNGGGWLHDDLVKLFSGEDYVTMVPRGKKVGKEPQNRWTKPVAVVMGEANYSDAHFFPYAFDVLDVGFTVGMPIPGTATAVWWERLQDPELVFGIPQVGVRGNDGYWLENTQLEPDFKVKNTAESIRSGRDLQLEKAVEILFQQTEDN